MKRIYLSSVAVVALGYSGSGTCETVFAKAKGGNGDVITVNADDFAADQEKPAAERQWSAHKGDDPVDTAADSGQTQTATGPAASDVNQTGALGATTAAPSAPDFNGPDAAPLLTDTVTGAVAPGATTADQLLVMKSGKKWFISDGVGTKITGDRAKQLGIDETGYDTEEMAKEVQRTTEPKPPVA